MCSQGIAPASLLNYVSGKNPLMLIAQIYYFTLDARELTRPMCFDLSRVAHFKWKTLSVELLRLYPILKVKADLKHIRP